MKKMKLGLLVIVMMVFAGFGLLARCSSTPAVSSAGQNDDDVSEVSVSTQTGGRDSINYSQSLNSEQLPGTWLLEDGGNDNTFSYLTFNPDGTFSLVAETDVFYMDMGVIIAKGQEISGEYEFADITRMSVNINIILTFNASNTNVEYPLKCSISDSGDTMKLIVNWFAESTYRKKEIL